MKSHGVLHTHTQQVIERALRIYKHLLHMRLSEVWGYMLPPSMLRKIFELEMKWLRMDFKLWTSVPASRIPALLFWYFHWQGPFIFHSAFLDGQPHLSSLVLPWMELLGCGCCLTVGNWFFIAQMQPDVDCCLMPSWDLPASRQMGNEMHSDFQRASAQRAAIKRFPILRWL